MLNCYLCICLFVNLNTIEIGVFLANELLKYELIILKCMREYMDIGVNIHLLFFKTY